MTEKEYKAKIKEAKSWLDKVYETYDAGDYTVIVGSTGGDPRKIRVYRSGMICEG